MSSNGHPSVQLQKCWCLSKHIRACSSFTTFQSEIKTHPFLLSSKKHVAKKTVYRTSVIAPKSAVFIFPLTCSSSFISTCLVWINYNTRNTFWHFYVPLKVLENLYLGKKSFADQIPDKSLCSMLTKQSRHHFPVSTCKSLCEHPFMNTHLSEMRNERLRVVND